MKKPQDAAPERETEAITVFYQECADLAGIEISEWLDIEPFDGVVTCT